MKLLKLLLLPSVVGFVTVRSRWGRAPAACFATVYYPSASTEDDYSGIDDEAPFFRKEPSELAQFLSREAVASLARLAVAFSPQGLKLKHLEDVHVLEVNSTHVDLEVVVCENDNCITLEVPVLLAHHCPVEQEMDDCVLDNLEEMDLEASRIIRQIEWDESHHEEMEDMRRQLLALQSTDDLHYPDWWTASGSLDTECQSMRRLLNEEDFVSEVKALAMQALGFETVEWMVEQVAVAAVGPSGLLLRATAKEVKIFDEESSLQLLEIPIAFTEKVLDVEALNSAVLGAVAAAGDFLEEVRI